MSDQATTTPPNEALAETSPSATTAPEPESILSAEAPEAPAPYDPETIKFPEGFGKDEALFGEFSNLAKETGLSGPAAQSLIDFYAKHLQTSSQKQVAEWDKQQEAWQAEVKGDKEIGGDKLNGILQTFSKVADDPTLSDPEFRKALAFTGAGNHPAVVRTLAKWAKALSEGGPVQGGPANGSAKQPGSIGEAIYGASGPHTGGPRFS